MQDPKKSDDTTQSGATTRGGAPAPEEYRHRNSGRRASGHGGGDMDAPEEFPEAHHEAGYDYSGGGHGHESNRSLDHEINEDLESRSGPYIRAGQPAQTRSEAVDAKRGKADASRKSGDTKK